MDQSASKPARPPSGQSRQQPPIPESLATELAGLHALDHLDSEDRPLMDNKHGTSLFTRFLDDAEIKDIFHKQSTAALLEGHQRYLEQHTVCGIADDLQFAYQI